MTNNWRKLSHINFDKMEIKNIEDTFSWYADGSNKVIIPNEKQSWKELVKKSTPNRRMPEIYMTNSLTYYNFFSSCSS